MKVRYQDVAHISPCGRRLAITSGAMRHNASLLWISTPQSQVHLFHVQTVGDRRVTQKIIARPVVQKIEAIHDFEFEQRHLDIGSKFRVLVRAGRMIHATAPRPSQSFESLPSQSLQGLSQGRRCFSHSATSWKFQATNETMANEVTMKRTRTKTRNALQNAEDRASRARSVWWW